MARRQALIAKLSAVETLGATGLILTDKTGTLTENRMAVGSIRLDDGLIEDFAESDSLGERIDEILKIAVLCSRATLPADAEGPEDAVGDPTEVAILVAGAARDLRREKLLELCPEIREEPFDSDTKMMATFHECEGQITVAVKGAPEAVLEQCVAVRSAEGQRTLEKAQADEWEDHIDGLAGRGLRTLAVATRVADDRDQAPYDDLVLLGVLGLLDPPRAGVREALAECRSAGIEVVMVTGDHLATAKTIAAQIGLLDPDDEEQLCIDTVRLGDLSKLDADSRRRLLAARVLARTTPAQKLDLIEMHQQQGRVVAMTGDGVNDAPALKKADIGVAMGIRGTQVAKEAAAMVLQDDEFSTIVHAVAQGRAIYSNIRKFVLYLLSCNLSEVLIVGLASLAGAPLPLLPLQILFLNLVTDVFPALALGVGEGHPALMRESPRPAGEPLVTRNHWILMGAYGLIITAAVLTAMALAVFWLGMEAPAAVTVSFLTLALAQLWHVFNMRDRGSGWFSNEVVSNPWVWGALVLCLGLLLAATYVPGLSAIMEIHPPSASGWGLIVVMSLVPVVGGPVARRLVL